MKSCLRWGCFALAAFLTASAWGAGRQLTGQHAPATTPALSPEEAQKRFTVPPGFEVRLFAAEPDVVNPVAMTWDERGRLWVVELYEYPLGAPKGAKPRDRVKIYEDTDGDGRADKVKVFADGLNLATGVLIGYGGVFVGQAPHLLFLEDTNKDDVADKTTIVKTGFGLEDRHELLNSFTWGPDGWLHMTHGVFTFSNVKNPDDPNDDGVEMTAAVARYHPRTKKFEVVSEGTSNPWGVDYDRAGNAFVTACVIDHMFHMAPGGLYVRQAGNPPHPFAYELLPSIVDHKHFRAAYAGIQVYQADQYPEEYRGMIFMGNIHDSSVHQDKLTPNGSSFKASFVQDFVRANDGWFRPVSTQVGPDGALWLMDWYDKYPCYQNANADPEGVDRERGRIWRVVYTGNEKGKAVRPAPAGLDMAKLSVPELVKTLAHPNVWHRRMAQRILSERREASAKEPLVAMVKSSSPLEARLFALWTLHSAELLDSSILDAAAKDSDPALRNWAARLTGERRDMSDAAAERLMTLAADKDPTVRLAVATAIRQYTSGSLTVNTPSPGGLEEADAIARIGAALIASSSDAKDPVIPFMIWHALEPIVAGNHEAALNWFRENGEDHLPLAGKLLTKTMRRISDVGEPGSLDPVIEFLNELPATSTALAIAAFDGLIEGQRGKVVSPGASASAALAKFSRSADKTLAAKAQQLGTMWGDAAALQTTLATVRNESADPQQRVAAIQSVKQQKVDAVRDALVGALKQGTPEPVALEAIRALSEVGGDNIGDRVIERWTSLAPGVKAAAASMLASRGQWTRSLLAAVEKQSIKPSEIPTPVIRSLTQSRDVNTRERAIRSIGRFRDPSQDKLALIEEKKRMILSGKPVDFNAGKEIAQRTCFNCHKLHGEGAEVGPDLTGVGRSSLDALLANVIDPNQIIGRGYEAVEVETKDGRSVSGRIVEDNEARVKLLSAGPKEEVVARNNIESMRVSDFSVMPEGLEQMPDDDFRNLIWFILNPPQDKKPIEVQMQDKKLVVRSNLPEGNGMADLLTYQMNPEFRGYLHPVKDPTGKTVVTEDKPADHIWQHGIFTGLHKVNGIDFWTEKEGKQRFVRISNITQEQDHAGWVALNEWVAPNGKVLLEEEQGITIHQPTTPYYYMIDFAWTLRAKAEKVTIGRYDYGGLAVRMAYNKTHTHLNSNGERAKETYDKRAKWLNVARAFDADTYGIVVLDHPSNPGHPAQWRVDDFGFINPSPSKQGDWTIEPNQSKTFRYRLFVHVGEGEAQYLDPAWDEFAKLKFDTVAALPSDGESVALWNPEWRVIAAEFEGTPRKLPEYHGRRNVLMTHPQDLVKGARLQRKIEVPKDKMTTLTLSAAAHDQGDWELRVYADDELLLKQAIDRKGERWKNVTVDLSRFAGKTINVIAGNFASDWSYEFGYWADIKVESKPLQQRAAK
ncbi:MAG TPA: PVC-type heme-binding CxxCH protein [Methylomirabilota bacterium]|nr:PVC-type heme-binding CxxCH protein [Methylomirabilota bacterium]